MKIGEKLKNSLANESNFKLVNELDGKRIRVLMDNDKSFKLIDPKTGKNIKIFMDNDKSFKLVTDPNKKYLMSNDKSFRLVGSDGKEFKFKLKNGKSFRLITSNSSERKVKKEEKVKNKDSEKILEIKEPKKKNKKDDKEKSKFEKFFTEPSFNLLEMIITIILVSIVLVVGVLWATKKDEDKSPLNKIEGFESIKDSRLTEFIDLYTDIVTNYYEDIDSDELLDTITEAMIEYLGDAYTGYMDEYEARNLKDTLNGKYEGLGLEMATRKDDEKVVITKIFEGGPASKSGLQVGDIIKSVNEIDITNKNSGEVSILIKDKLTGTISVVVERDGKELTFHVKKGTVIIKAVTSELFDKVGYIKIDAFSNMAVNQVQMAISELESKGMESLVVDVRNNNGGYLNSAYNIADLFLEKNKVIYKLKTNKEVETYKATSNSSKNFKVAVLINGGSASASEVFALAMRDSYGATLIGSKSYGKGTVQETSQLSTGSLVKYTIANWLGPKGESINGIGIRPDIYADMGAAYIKEQTYENDGQLQRAIKVVSE